MRLRWGLFAQVKRLRNELSREPHRYRELDKRMKDMILIAVVATLLSGCTARTSTPVDQKMALVTTGPLTQTEWVHAAQYSIQSKFSVVDLYSGKRCKLLLNVTKDGLLLSTNAQGGDPELCEAAIAAVKQAKLPLLTAGLPHEIPLMSAPASEQYAQAARKSAVETWHYKDVVVSRDKLGIVSIDGKPAVMDAEELGNKTFSAGISQVIFYKNGKVALMQNGQFKGWMK